MAPELEPTTATMLDAAARQAFDASAGTPSAVVGVRTADGTWIGAYGLAHPAAGVAMTADTHLRIGSVTKTFTATLLLQAVAAGDLTLEDTIDRYRDDVPNGERITLGMLAGMRSGLANYTDDPALAGRILADPAAPFTDEEMIGVGLANSPVSEPDRRFAYCNTNYLLLGRVLEQVTGTPFDVLLAERILDPLGLTETWWPGESIDLPSPYAQGFTLLLPGGSPEHPVNTTHVNPSWAGAAGALVSTVGDMLTYARALVTGDGLLDADMQARRLASLRPAPAFGAAFTYGIGLIGAGGWIGHSGDTPGYRSSVYHHLEIDTSLVVLTGSDIASGGCPEAMASVSIPGGGPCLAGTNRIFGAVSEALGQPTALAVSPVDEH